MFYDVFIIFAGNERLIFPSFFSFRIFGQFFIQRWSKAAFKNQFSLFQKETSLFVNAGDQALFSNLIKSSFVVFIKNISNFVINHLLYNTVVLFTKQLIYIVFSAFIELIDIFFVSVCALNLLLEFYH